jgi:hypothetical protein
MSRRISMTLYEKLSAGWILRRYYLMVEDSGGKRYAVEATERAWLSARVGDSVILKTGETYSGQRVR